MKTSIRKILIIMLAWSLIGYSFPMQSVSPPLSEMVKKSYLEILDLSQGAGYSAREFESYRKQLAREEEAEKARLEKERKDFEGEIKALRQELEVLNKRASRDSEETALERRQLHCRIVKLESRMKESEIARKQGVPIAFDNKRAKLALLQQWPAEARGIGQAISAGQARARRFGNVEDIGVRAISEGQEKDIKLGQDAINEMKAYGLFPPEWEEKVVNDYVRYLAETLAVNSDLKIPLKVTVLESDEVNAFALPGGYLFVNTGLIARTETESELVGVMAHEISHITARHSAKLMKRATIAGIIFQAAQVAAMILTGGIVGIGTYYALQYGFLGLGLVLDLALLGVSREFEDEADQLGVQYAWKAGYDPRGFITLFDKLATEKGYVTTTSFFRTHPPYAERILSTFRELTYLPEKDNLQVDSLRFQQVRQHLVKLREEARKQPLQRPTLKRFPDCEEELKKPVAAGTVQKTVWPNCVLCAAK